MSGLVVTGLSAGYKRQSVLVDLTLPTVAPGNLLALLGPNAAGKSTLLRAIAGLGNGQGEVVLNGQRLADLSTAKRARLVGYLAQSLPPTSPLVAYEAVLAACRAVRDDFDRATVEASIEQAFSDLGVVNLALRRMDQLSGGQRQMIGLAQVLVRHPSLILLDEPTSALDLRWQLSVITAIKRRLKSENATAIIAMHDINLAVRTCDQVAVIAGGELIAAGSPEEAVMPDVITRAYGVNCRVERCSAGTPIVLVDSAV